MVELLFFAHSVFVGKFYYLLSVAGVLQCCLACIVVLQQVVFLFGFDLDVYYIEVCNQ